jgi:hypothetical protein
MTFDHATAFGKITGVLSVRQGMTKVTCPSGADTLVPEKVGTDSKAADTSILPTQLASGTSVGVPHFFLDALGELLDFLRLLDHIQREYIGAGTVHVQLEFCGQGQELFSIMP